jgi:hypothetical protein
VLAFPVATQRDGRWPDPPTVEFSSMVSRYGAGLWVSSQSAQEGVRRRLALKPHPDVHCDDPVRSGDDRVEVDLGDLGMV